MITTMNKPVVSLISGENPNQVCIDVCGKYAEICEE